MATSDDSEEWRPVVGWEGLYSVSSLGRIRSEPRAGRSDRMLRPLDGGRGYAAVGLSRDGVQTRRLIHGLVAEAFLGPRPEGSVVHHRNGIKTDNPVANLTYVTRHQIQMLFLGREDRDDPPESPRIRATGELLNADSELWRPVVGFEGWYEVSQMGRVRRAEEHRDWRSHAEPLKAIPTQIGYYQVPLSREGKIKLRTVHSLVMEAFVGSRPEGYETNHRDGDKANNHLANLEYVTRSQNKRHAFDLGLYKVGENHWTHRHEAGHPGGRVLEPEEVMVIRQLHRDGISMVDIAAEFGRPYGTIRAIVKRWRWKHLP